MVRALAVYWTCATPTRAEQRGSPLSAAVGLSIERSCPAGVVVVVCTSLFRVFLVFQFVESPLSQRAAPTPLVPSFLFQSHGESACVRHVMLARGDKPAPRHAPLHQVYQLVCLIGWYSLSRPACSANWRRCSSSFLSMILVSKNFSCSSRLRARSFAAIWPLM